MFRNSLITNRTGKQKTQLGIGGVCLLVAVLATTVANDASNYVATTGRIGSEQVAGDDPGGGESSVAGDSEEAFGDLPFGESHAVELPNLAAGGSRATGGNTSSRAGTDGVRPTSTDDTAGDDTSTSDGTNSSSTVATSASTNAAGTQTSATQTAAAQSSGTQSSGTQSSSARTAVTPTAQPQVTSANAAANVSTTGPTTTTPTSAVQTAATAAQTTTAVAVSQTPAPTVPAARTPINGYNDNLDMIRAQPVRNRNHDGSPYRNVPQASLDTSDGSPLLGPRSAYLNNPNGNPEQAFPIPAGGQFRIACEFSHFAYDDPLVAPGRPGGAHLHMYFGNTDVNAYSNYQTLRDSGSSTCNGQELNRTGYWAAAMIDGDGNVRIPERVVVYYKAEGIARGKVQTYKPGMANISPDRAGVAEVAGNGGGAAGEVEFKCSDNFSGGSFATSTGRIPNCNGSQYGAGSYPGHRVVLEMEVKFWHCFDPSRSASDIGAWVPAGSGRGHWFYGNCDGSGGGSTSPAYETYPHLSYFINYVVEPGEDTSSWFLSSDVDPASVTGTPKLRANPGGTHHADWWGAWHPDINREFVDNCVNYADGAASGCGFGYLSNGGPNGNSPNGGRALRYRPQYDRPGDSGTVKVPLQSLFAQLCTPLVPNHSYSSPMSGAWCKP